jgi:hypothetical protein
MAEKAKKPINPVWIEWATKVKVLRDELEPLSMFNGRAIEIRKELAVLREDIPDMYEKE